MIGELAGRGKSNHLWFKEAPATPYGSTLKKVCNLGGGCDKLTADGRRRWGRILAGRLGCRCLWPIPAGWF